MSKAPQITPRPTNDWPASLDEVSADMNGTPINVHKLMAHSPDLLKAWWDFRNYSVKGGTLGEMLGELVILRVGVHLGAWYEWASHVDRAHRIGIPITTINAVLLRDPTDMFPPDQALILTAVDNLMADGRILQATLDAMSEHFTTKQIMDLIAIHGMYVVLGHFIKTWGLALDDTVLHRIEGLADETTFNEAAKKFADTAKI